MIKYCISDSSILEISGADNKAFLQGLITQDINLTNNGNSIYSLLLNSRGRYLYDFYITPYNNCLLININNSDLTSFLKLLSIYKLRSKISFKILDNYKIYRLLANETIKNKFDQTTNTTIINENIIIKDPRLEELGFILISPNITNLNTEELSINDLNLVTINEYDDLRFSLGIAEHNELIKEKSIPLECGFEELNAVSFNKGCYLGQEFTNASKRTMEIRKRIISLETLSDNLNDIQVKDPIIDHTNNEIGTILGVNNKKALALVKMKEIINKTTEIFIKSNTQSIKVKPTINSWIKNYSLN
ncbi:YgfZ/GcvT domain-containing protein [Rickettsiales bacterium LUAb2]